MRRAQAAPSTPRRGRRAPVASSSKHKLDELDDDVMILDTLPPPSNKRSRIAAGSSTNPFLLDSDKTTHTVPDDEDEDEVMMVDGIMTYTPRPSRRAAKRGRNATQVNLTGSSDEDDGITVIGVKPAQRRPRVSRGTVANPIVLGGEDDLVPYNEVHPNPVKLPIDGFPHIVLDILLNAPPEATRGIAGINRWFLEQMDKRFPEHYLLTDCGNNEVAFRVTCGHYLGIKRMPQTHKFVAVPDPTPNPNPYHILQHHFQVVQQQVQWMQQQVQVMHNILVGQSPTSQLQVPPPIPGQPQPHVPQNQSQPVAQAAHPPGQIAYPEDTSCRVMEFQRYPDNDLVLNFLKRFPAKILRGNVAMAGHAKKLPWTTGTYYERGWGNLSTLVLFGRSPAAFNMSIPQMVTQLVFNIEVVRSGAFWLPNVKYNGYECAPLHRLVYIFPRGSTKATTSILIDHIATNIGAVNGTFTIVNFPGSHRLVETGNETGRRRHEHAFQTAVLERLNTKAAHLGRNPVRFNVEFFTHDEYKRKLGAFAYAEMTMPISLLSWEKPVRTQRRPRV